MQVKSRNPALREAFSFAGGVAGLVLFLTMTLESALIYGGAAGIAIVHGLGLSAPSEALGSRVIVWVGMLLGALATAAIMIILGAVVGAVFYGLIGRRLANRAAEDAEEEELP